MEEEIITPEEEVFDYHTLRYILDKDGYVCHASLGGLIICDLGECTEYKGEVPDGYETIEEWHDKEIERLNSWKVVNGDLVFDANRDYKLKIIYEQENNENSHVTRKELGMASTEEINPYTDLYPSQQSAGGYITGLDGTFNKVGNLPTEEVNLSLFEKQDLDLIELEFIGNNFLPNTATSGTNNGITYTQNKDKTIKINGTATDRSTLNLAGTDTSVRNVLTFKGICEGYDANGNVVSIPTSYLLSDLPNGVSIEFYHYDGSDRTLVGSYNGGVISFEEDTNVTQVVLVIENGTKINETIKPMLSLVGVDYPILPMTKYTGSGDRNGQYYVDGISTQFTGDGKNKYDGTTASSSSSNGVTLSARDNIITLDGISTGDSKLHIATAVLPAGTYTASAQYFSGTFSNPDYGNFTILRVWEGTSWTAFGNEMNISGSALYNQASATFTLSADTEISLGFYVRNTDKFNDLKIQYQIVEGSTPDYKFELYGVRPSPDLPSRVINTYQAGTYNVIGNNVVYQLTIDEDLRSLPNGVADRLWFDIDGDNGIDIERKVGRVVFDGSEGYWGFSEVGTTNQRFDLELSKIGLTNIADGDRYCSHFIPKGSGNSAPWGEYYISTAWLVINDNDNVITSLDEFKNWLSNNNVEIYYPLATYTTSIVNSYYLEKPEYEEYKNNTTLIDLKENTFEDVDRIVIKDNQIVLVKKGAIEQAEDENGNEIEIEKEEIYLGDTVMPRTYTPYTYAYCHQKIYINFKYKDPRNVDITKINLKGLISITDIETEYNFTLADAEKVLSYANGETTLTDKELEMYDINADGVVDKLDATAILRMYYGYISNTVRGTLEINSTKAQRTIVLRDAEGKIKTSLGLNGITTPSLSVNGTLVETNVEYLETPTTTLLNGKRVYKLLFTGNMPSSTGGYNIPIDVDFNEAWVDESLSYLTSDTETLSTNFYQTNTDYLRTRVNKVDKVIRMVIGGNYSSYKYNLVLAYTKDDNTEEPEENPIIEVNKTNIINGSTNSNYWTFKTVAVEESINKNNNTSTIKVTNYLGRNSSAGSSYFKGTYTTNYICGNETHKETMYRSSGTISAGGWYELGSHTFTISHTEEPMNINVGGSMSTSDFNPSSASASGNITLTKI